MNKLFSRLIYILVVSSVLFTSCGNKNKDKEIEARIVERTTADANMKGLTASVKDGVVTLSGQCKDETCKTSCAQSVQSIAGVKQVINNITVPEVQAPAPVTITADDPLKASVDNAILNYKGVSADVSGGVVTLRGEIKKSELQNLMQALHSLQPKNIVNQLVVK